MASAEEKGAKVCAAGYIRVSQERQVTNGYGLDVQEEDIRKFADYKGWTLTRVYREEGVSGYKRERPALDAMLAAAHDGQFSVVVFPSIDRAGRSVRDVIEIDRSLREHGIETVFLREGVDTSTPTGELFRNIMASLAEFEGRVIVERTRKGKMRKRAAGGYIGGGVPYGYRLEDGRFVVVPEEAAVVKRIFRWKAEGRGNAWIAEKLNTDRTLTRNGGPWRASTLWNMLHNHTYTGCVRLDGELRPGQHDAIVSGDAFKACNTETEQWA